MNGQWRIGTDGLRGAGDVPLRLTVRVVERVKHSVVTQSSTGRYRRQTDVDMNLAGKEAM